MLPEEFSVPQRAPRIQSFVDDTLLPRFDPRNYLLPTYESTPFGGLPVPKLPKYVGPAPLPGEAGFIGPLAPVKPSLPPPMSATRWSWRGHRNAALAEEQLANRVHGLPDEVVIRWGDPIGTHGGDVISVNIRSGRVTLWDSKFRSNPRRIDPTPTFAPQSSRLSNAIQEAIASLRGNTTLPVGVRDAALRELLAGRVRTRTTGAGSARNSTLR
jgi:hypothetical protein